MVSLDEQLESLIEEEQRTERGIEHRKAQAFSKNIPTQAIVAVRYLGSRRRSAPGIPYARYTFGSPTSGLYIDGKFSHRGKKADLTLSLDGTNVFEYYDKEVRLYQPGTWERQLQEFYSKALPIQKKADLEEKELEISRRRADLESKKREWGL